MATINDIVSGFQARNAQEPQDDKLKALLQQLDMQRTQQSINASRSPLGVERNANIDIRSPGGLEMARETMRKREVPLQTDADNIFAQAVARTKMETEPEAGQRELTSATWKRNKDLESVDTSVLDDIVTGKTIDWTQLAKARPYLTDDQAKEAMQPWEEKVRQSNSLNRLWSSQTNKDEQRLNAVNNAHEDAINIVRKITPGLGDFNGSSYEKFRQSIRSSGMSYMTDKAQKEALKQRLKNDVAANVDPNNIFKNDTAAKQSEVQRLWKIIDEEYSK